MTIQVVSNDKPVPETKAPQAATAKEAPSVEHTTSAPEASASEHNEATESETEATGEVSETTETEASEESETETTDATEKDKPKKKGGFQRRIDKLNARNSATEQERDYWKQQAMKSPAETKKENVETKTVQVDGKPKVDDFETHAEYVEALTDWKTEQKLNERDRRAEKARAESEQNSILSAHAKRINAFRAAHEDFEETIENLNDVPRSPALEQVIVSSEIGPEMLYELAKNPEEAARIAKLPPLAAAREMGKLEAKLALKTTANKTEETKKVTSAPKPVDPVGGGKGAVKKTIYDSNLTQKEYEAIRAKQRSAS